MPEHPQFDYRLEHLFSYRIAWASPPEVIGPTPEGLRVNFHFVVGELSGEMLHLHLFEQAYELHWATSS